MVASIMNGATCRSARSPCEAVVLIPPCGMRTYPTMRKPSLPRRSASAVTNLRLNRSESKRRARSPVLFPTYRLRLQ